MRIAPLCNFLKSRDMELIPNTAKVTTLSKYKTESKYAIFIIVYYDNAVYKTNSLHQ
jgi:hypothetical protein